MGLCHGVLLLLIFIAGCSSLNQQGRLSRVRVGQTPSDVVAAIGEPVAKSQRTGVEVWYYEIYSYDGTHVYPYSAFFKAGRLSDFRFDTAGNQDDHDLRLKRSGSLDKDPAKPLGEPNTHNGNGSPQLQGEPPQL